VLGNQTLVTIYAQDRHLFFLYRVKDSNAKLRRVTVTFTGSGHEVHNDIGPVTIPGVGDGNSGSSFAGRGTVHQRIYLTARKTGSDEAVIVKDTVNDGHTWNTFATNPNPLANAQLYSLSGTHRLGPGGQVLAAFTDDNGSGSDVYFLHNSRMPPS
jgi:hypothetical protein